MHNLRGFSIESLPYYLVKVYGKPGSIRAGLIVSIQKIGAEG
jgi:hypothetical protein